MMIQNSLFPPQRMCAQLDDVNLLQFLSYWVMFNKPCSLTLHRGKKSPSLVAVCFTLEHRDTDTKDFAETACAKTGARLWNLTEEKKK